ncbi:MAG: DUF4013 domain-containing protein [Burkholderiales bacterium]|nr:DUF4013 domain-containing protein [Burkholderiales bacterium]
MDISRAFSYPRNDPRWFGKLLSLGLISIFPIVNLIGMGYMVEALRRVARGDEATLPEWDNYGGYFMDGLRVTVTYMVYALPLLLVIGVLLGVVIASGNDEARGMGLLSMLANLFQMFWQFLLWVVWPALLLQVAFREGWAVGFDFAAMMSNITRNIGAYVMVLVMTVAFGILGTLGILACGVGILITGPYAQMCMAHLFGQLAQGNMDQVHPAEYS